MNLHQYNLIIINSSAGKDSLCCVFEICRMADLQGYDRSKIVVSHQDLGHVEWSGTKELCKKQADLFGLDIHYSKQRNMAGKEETLLEYVEKRGMWPSNKTRYCTSDFKRGPGGRVVTKLSKDLGPCKILYVFGFRAEESPARSKKEVLSINKKLTTKTRLVHDYNPILDWKLDQVWSTIRSNNLPYHPAYDLGMPRLSCVFCVFSPFDALVIAGKANPDLLEEYVQLEDRIQHSFRQNMTIRSVQEAIKNGYEPQKIDDWIM